MPILNLDLRQAGSQKTLSSQRMRPDAMAIRAAVKKPKGVNNQKIRPERRLEKYRRSIVLEKPYVRV